MKNSSLVEDNINLVHYVLHKNFSINENSKYLSSKDYDDLFQEGCLALCIAAERFDESKGLQFSTYACSYIDGFIRTYIAHKDNLINVSNYGLQRFSKISQVCKENDLNIEIPSDLEKAFSLSNTPFKYIEEMGRVLSVRNTISLSNVIHFGDTGELEMSDIMSTKEIGYAEIELSDYLDKAMDYVEKRLSLKDYTIYDMYIKYLKTGIKLNQVYLGKLFNCSQTTAGRAIRKGNSILSKYIKSKVYS